MTQAIDISVQTIFDQMEYKPNPVQRKVHDSIARNRVNAAGRRCGKSTGGGYELVVGAMEAYTNRTVLDSLNIRHEEWIVGPNYTDSEKEFRVFYNACKKKGFPFDRPGTYYTKSEMTVSLWGGLFIVSAKSGAHPESLVGEGLHRVIMAEAAKMKESVWERFVRPMLADFGGESIWSTTPEGRNWFYDIWRRGKDPMQPDWASWRHPSWMNRRVYRKKTTREDVQRLLNDIDMGNYDPAQADSYQVDPEIIALAVDLTTEAFEQEIGCSFTQMAGRVFKAWDEEVHVGDFPYNISWPLYIATDYGYTDPNVALFIQVDPHGVVYVIAEYYRHQRTDNEFADDVVRDERLGRLLPFARMIYPDPEDPGATRTISERWKVPWAGGTGGELKDRLEAIELSLRITHKHLPYGHVDRQPRLHVDRSCVNLMREMDAYSWPAKRADKKPTVNKQKDKPLDGNDHAPEALGRFFAGHFGVGGRPLLGDARPGRTSTRSRPHRTQQPRGVRR